MMQFNSLNKVEVPISQPCSSLVSPAKCAPPADLIVVTPADSFLLV